MYLIFERKDKPTGKGNPLVFILTKSKKKVSTGRFCKPGSWDQTKQKVIEIGLKKDPLAQVTNGKLKKDVVAFDQILAAHSDINTIRKLYREYLSGPAFTITDGDEVIRTTWPKRVLERFTHSPNQEVFMEFERMIYANRGIWNDKTANNFRSLGAVIVDYQPGFRFEDISEEWWKDWVIWLSETRGVISNTIHARTSQFKELIKYFRPRYNYPHGLEDKLNWSYIEPNRVGYTWEQVLKLRDLNIEEEAAKQGVTLTPSMQDNRTLFVIGCFTGRRWEEVASMGPSNFRLKDGKWRYYNIGKRQTIIDVPLLDEAVEYLKAMNFTPPKGHLSLMNKEIKVLCKLAGFTQSTLKIIPINKNKVEKLVVEEWAMASFHLSRHSFAKEVIKRVGQLKISPPEALKMISALLGHTSFKTSWKYSNLYSGDIDVIFDQIVKRNYESTYK